MPPLASAEPGTEPWALTATELAAAYSRRETTPSQALASVLQRVAAVNPALNAIVTLDAPGAQEAAAAADKRLQEGKTLGPLDGIPITIKDNLHVAGLRATWGSLLYNDFVAPRDDLPVARLRAAGAVIIGKTNCPELALSGYTDNRVFGSTGNPWSPDFSPGGSSGGAVAAIASGAGPLALATDAGGSIRRPSGHAGVAGLKPGLARVPRRYGFPPLAHDLQVIGHIARSVADLAAMFAIIATPNPALPPAATSLRIAAFGTIGDFPIEPAITEAFETSLEALRSLGHPVTIISPLWDPDEVATLFGLLASVGVARVMASHPGWEHQVTPTIAQQAQAGAQVSASDYVAALDRLALFRWSMLDAMQAWDAVVTPSSPALPWPRTQPNPQTIGGTQAGPRAASIFSTAINLAGLPALVVPAPVAAGVLPAGLQLIGNPMSEELLLALGQQFETAHPWPRLAPSPP